MKPAVINKKRVSQQAIFEALEANNKPVHAWGFVISQTINKNKNKIAALMQRFGIKEPVTPAGIYRAVLKGGKPFLAALDNEVIRPFSSYVGAEIDMVDFDASGPIVPEWYTTTTKDASRKQRDPERGTKILGALDMLINTGGAIVGGIRTIKGTPQNPTPIVGGSTVYTPAVTTVPAEEENKNKNLFLYGGIALVALILIVLVISKKSK